MLILAPVVDPSSQQGPVQICEGSIIIVTCVHAAGVEFSGSPKTSLTNNIFHFLAISPIFGIHVTQLR